MEELESTDSLNPKIAEKNSQIGKVRQQINGISDRQKELLAEREQHEEVMRCGGWGGGGGGGGGGRERELSVCCQWVGSGGWAKVKHPG